MDAFKPGDIARLRTLSDIRFSPDGRTVSFSETGMDVAKNEYHSRIFTMDVDAEEPQPFTDGTAREGKARWNPDGSRIAYVAHPTERGASLMVAPFPVGTSWMVAEMTEDIEEVEWSPDGRSIAFTARDRDEQMHGPEKPKDQAPKRIDHMVYRLDNVGWTVGRNRQLFVVPAEGGGMRRLTAMPTDVSGIAWAPDSRSVVTSSADHPTWDVDGRDDLFAVDIDGTTVERLTPNDGSYSNPSFRHDGSMVALHYCPEPLNGPFHTQIAVLELASRRITILTEDLDRNCAPYTMSREPQWETNTVFFNVEDSGNVHLYRAAISGDVKPELLVGGDRSVSSFAVSGDSMVMSCTAPTIVSRLELARPGEEIRVLYDPNSSFASEVILVAPERFVARSPDGAEVEAWVMTPPNLDKRKKYPMLLNIHGGPFSQYGNKFFDEFQVYASAGYVVVYSNPRGSSGYPQAWGRAIKGPKTDEPGPGWGSVDYDDLMAVTDEALNRYDFVDPERVGVMGGSYGGYMTTWIIGHTSRFKAAISERAVNNMYTMAHASDVAAYFGVEMGTLYLDDPDEYTRISPITYVSQIQTPVMIIHSEDDLRCPIEQAEQLFMALKRYGRQVEFVRFPGESHELSRSGGPKHRIQRFEIILDWFERKL